jgi:hypothetical protein
MIRHDDDKPSLETDERFVSGPWRGFYVQWGTRGKQELSLTFFDGQIVGDGADPAGDFRVRGGYDIETGKVWMHKVYPEHTVEYDGHAEPGKDKGIWGAWQIRYGFTRDHGGFHIWPDAHAEGESRSLSREQPAPAREMAEAFSGGQWGSQDEWGKMVGE